MSVSYSTIIQPAYRDHEMTNSSWLLAPDQCREPRTISFRCLGPLECWAGTQQIEVRGSFQRTLLAALLITNPRPVSVDALFEELWGDEPPIKADNALQAHISRLRRKIRQVPGADLITTPSGYALLVGGENVDARVFLQCLHQVRSQVDQDLVTQIGILRSALGLWRGPVFGGHLGGPICQAAAARYEADRLIAMELLLDLELRRGRHFEIIPELIELTEAQPLNERFCEQLMVAMYRSGRQTEALEVYRRLRSRMDSHLGMDPSPEVREYERAILAHDPALLVGGDHTVLRAPFHARSA